MVPLRAPGPDPSGPRAFDLCALLDPYRIPLLIMLLISGVLYYIRLLGYLPFPPISLPHPLEHLVSYGFLLLLGLHAYLWASAPSKSLGWPRNLRSALGYTMVAAALVAGLLEMTASMSPDHIHNDVVGVFD